jgi:excisionase family DNA binding protein
MDPNPHAKPTGQQRLLVTVKATADSLSVSVKTVRRRIADGTIASVTIGRSVRIPMSEVERLAATGASRRQRSNDKDTF